MRIRRFSASCLVVCALLLNALFAVPFAEAQGIRPPGVEDHDANKPLKNLGPNDIIRYGRYEWKLVDSESGELVYRGVNSSKHAWQTTPDADPVNNRFSPLTDGSIGKYLNSQFLSDMFDSEYAYGDANWIRQWDYPTMVDNEVDTASANVGLLTKKEYELSQNSALWEDESYNHSWYLMSSTVTGSVYYVDTDRSVKEMADLTVEMNLRPVIHVDNSLYAIAQGDGNYYELSDTLPMPETLSDAYPGSIIQFGGHKWILTDPFTNELLLQEILPAQAWESDENGQPVSDWDSYEKLRDWKENDPHTLAFYLNHEFLNSLSHKEWIVPSAYPNEPIVLNNESYPEYSGDEGTSYQAITKVGLLSYESYQNLYGPDDQTSVLQSECEPDCPSQWWIMNPFQADSHYYGLGLESSQGSVESLAFGEETYGVRPVIHLSRLAAVTEGSGTSSEPYEVSVPESAVHDFRINLKDSAQAGKTTRLEAVFQSEHSLYNGDSVTIQFPDSFSMETISAHPSMIEASVSDESIGHLAKIDEVNHTVTLILDDENAYWGEVAPPNTAMTISFNGESDLYPFVLPSASTYHFYISTSVDTQMSGTTIQVVQSIPGSGSGGEPGTDPAPFPVSDTSGDGFVGVDDIMQSIMQYSGTLTKAQVEALLRKIEPRAFGRS